MLQVVLEPPALSEATRAVDVFLRHCELEARVDIALVLATRGVVHHELEYSVTGVDRRDATLALWLAHEHASGIEHPTLADAEREVITFAGEHSQERIAVSSWVVELEAHLVWVCDIHEAVRAIAPFAGDRVCELDLLGRWRELLHSVSVGIVSEG